MSNRTIVVASTLFISSLAGADIGFGAAIDGARAAAPAANLFSIQQRERNGAMVYEGELYNMELTSRFQPRLDIESGELIRLDVNAVGKQARMALQPIADRLGELQLDYMDAIMAANDASERSDVQQVSLDLEAGILAYQVEYFDGATKIYIDGATGGVIPHHGADDDMDPTNPATSVLAALGLAADHKGEGWVAIGLENEAEKGGNIVEVLLVDLASGMLSMVRVGGDAVLSSDDFSASGSQVQRVNAIRDNWGSVMTDLAGAVAATEAEYPGAGIAEAEFEVETEKTGTSLMWKLNIITADLIEIDFMVDASMPIGNGFRFATAPVEPLPGDFNRDGVVNALDLTDVFDAWGSVNPAMDVNGDALVGPHELTTVISNWG